jgi:beta-glucanase (GH16 family)
MIDCSTIAGAVLKPISQMQLRAGEVMAVHERLVWAEEGAGPRGGVPDPQLWGVRETDQWQPAGELQTYTTDLADAYYDGEGHLVIAARRHATADRPITSARLSARHAQRRHVFRFGRFEARLRVPTGAGVWPAFWLLGEDDRYGWPECGEIDVMEAPSGPGTHGQVHQGVHCPSADGGSSSNVSVRPSDGHWGEDFHTYGVMWRPGSVEFSVDGEPTGVVTRSAVEAIGGRWVFDDRLLSPIVNLAVGGWAGAPGDLPRQEMVIDWVRVWA